MSTWLERIESLLARSGLVNQGVVDVTSDKTLASLRAHSQQRTSLGADEFITTLKALLPDHLCAQSMSLLCEELGNDISLWKALGTEHTYALVRYGDLALALGEEESGIAAFVEALKRVPALVDELGDEVHERAQRLGGNRWLPFRLACLQASLTINPDHENDRVRELYSELLEEFAHDVKALETIRVVGKTLHAAIQDGSMPRAMMLRAGPRTPKSKPQ